MKKDGKMVALETGNEVVWEEEENWKFKLGNHRRSLKQWIGDPQCRFSLLILLSLWTELASPR